MFGLQRSGTNYVEWVLRENLPVDMTKRAGWKHGLPSERRAGSWAGAKPQRRTISEELGRRGVRPVVVRKDLDHWVESIRRNPQDYDRGPAADAWHGYYAEWEPLAPIVRYEDFLEDFNMAVERLAGLLGVEPVSFRQPDKVKHSPEWTPDHRRRYL